MFSDKKTLYSVTVSSFAVLLAAFFVPGEHSGRIAAAVLLLPLAAVAWFFIKRRGILSINKKEVTMLLGLIGIVCIVLYYLTGLNFGFKKNLYFLNLGYIIPLTVIIVSTEVMRFVIRAQCDKGADTFCYLACVIADALAFGNVYYIVSFNRFMDFLGRTYTYIPSVFGFISHLGHHRALSRAP